MSSSFTVTKGRDNDCADDVTLWLNVDSSCREFIFWCRSQRPGAFTISEKQNDTLTPVPVGGNAAGATVMKPLLKYKVIIIIITTYKNTKTLRDRLYPYVSWTVFGRESREGGFLLLQIIVNCFMRFCGWKRVRASFHTESFCLSRLEKHDFISFWIINTVATQGF